MSTPLPIQILSQNRSKKLRKNFNSLYTKPKNRLKIQSTIQSLHRNLYSPSKTHLQQKSLPESSHYTLPKLESPRNQLNGLRRVCQGLNIVKLPKYPFGIHPNYNNDQGFVKKYIVPDPSSPNYKEVESLKKRWQQLDQKRKLNSYSNPRNYHFSAMNEYDRYQTEAGGLYCLRENKIIRTYNEQKRKDLSQIKKNLEKLRVIESNLKEKEGQKKKVRLERLHPLGMRSQSPNARYFSERYPFLFKSS